MKEFQSIYKMGQRRVIQFYKKGIFGLPLYKIMAICYTLGVKDAMETIHDNQELLK